MRSILHKTLLALAVVLPLGLPATGQDLLETFEPSVTEFTLDNGLTFLVVERPEAPVVTFYTYADVGAVDEVKGITGMAHMFEHMAFKGTTTVGSLDIEAELAAMEKVDALYAQLKAEQQQVGGGDPEQIAALEAAFEEAQEEAAQHYDSGAFTRLIEQSGGTGINASTAWDRTDYFYSLPANKLELWFALESDRFLNPVLREFYTERDVIAEERRMRTESNPFGRVVEEFFALSYKAHPYGEPLVGHMADIQSYTREEAEAFFERYYNAANLTIAIVGAVDPDEVRALAETYFGRLPQGEKPGRVETVEPPQLGERRMVIQDPSQPILVMGWHKPSVNHPGDPVYEVLADVLSAGRTSRLYTGLVEEELALNAELLNSFPGLNKYPNQMLFLGIPAQGVSPGAVEDSVLAIIDDVRENGVTDAELERAKTRARATLVRQLQSRNGVASLLAYYEVVTGDWRNLFRRLDALASVTSDDIQRVVQETFVPSNRTVVMIETAAPGTASTGAPAGGGSTGG